MRLFFYLRNKGMGLQTVGFYIKVSHQIEDAAPNIHIAASKEGNSQYNSVH